MSVWDTTTPAGSDLLSGGDDRIRELKTALQDALRCDDTEGVESVFPGSSPSTAPVFRYRGLRGTTGDRPAAGQYGLFADTTKFVLQRDNGVSWDDIATYIPTGTKMVFYQTSAPVGWTAVAVNDKFLRVVTAGGSGGSTGGTVAASTSLAHTHTVASHTHTGPDHSHTFNTSSITRTGDSLGSSDSDRLVVIGGIVRVTTGGTGSTTKDYLNDHTNNDGTGNTGAATPGTDSQLGVFAYADVIVATKD